MGQPRERPLFRPVRVGAPFLLGVAIPTLLEAMPPLIEGLEHRPLEGRRLITFTDSRQGTARIAVKLQQESERDYVRSLLYHSLIASTEPADPVQIQKIYLEIKALEPLVRTTPVLRSVLDQKRQDLAKLEAPPLGRLAWEEAENKLLNADDFHHWLLPAIKELTFGLSERQLAKLCLLREFFLRPKHQFSLEGLGLTQLHYPVLEKANPPAVMQQRGVKPEEWRVLLQVSVDNFLRSSNSPITVTPDIIRWFGYSSRSSFLLPPGGNKIKGIQRVWPSAYSRWAKRNRLIRLLSHVFHLEIEIAGQCSQLDEMLIAIWGDIRPLLSQTETGFQMEPDPANFLQRAGRAGRRGETAALSFTLCKATPQGEAVFQNPLWPFVSRLGLPSVALHSEPIIQRHLNALALAVFLRDRIPDIRRLHTSWFFETADADTSAICDRFATWCEEGQSAELMTAGITALAARTVLAGRSAASLLTCTAQVTCQASERWRKELAALLDQ